jgi:RNA polymerase subunit RPABC4/transcription elongation factor Spt4
VGVFEVLPVSPKIRELIGSGATDEEIRSASVTIGMTSMEDDGHEKAEAGVTTLQEVSRVVEKDEVFKSSCPQCDHAIRIDFLVCPYCGADSPYVCNSCGKMLQHDWTTCPYCREKKPEAHHHTVNL